MEKKSAEMQIDLKQLCFSILRRFWLILIVGVLLGALFFGYASTCVDDEYAAEVRMYVNNTYGAGTVGFSSSQMSAAQSLASTYMIVLDSYDVLESVASVAKDQYDASKTYSVQELRSMITTSAIDETEVFHVVVVSTNKNDAVKIANAVKDVLPEVVNGLVGGRGEEEGTAAPLVSLQKAEYRGKVAPNEKRYALVGFLCGALLSVVAVVARDLLDTSINSETFLTDVYEDIPLLAVIPDAENPKSGSGYKGYYTASNKKKPPVQKKGDAK